VKQISIQIADETARQIAWLAEHWGYSAQRHNTAVVERAVNTLFMLEYGCQDYARRLKELGVDPEETNEVN
jgi:hypothetical protein